ncbi:MAG: ABC transporter permease subunit [Desulfotomaculaceae bacterium]|nr:ABC transporter permease subunit [Desulfotomaculaceae bacterium]
MKKAAVFVFICLMIAVIPAGCGKSEKAITKLDDAVEAKIGVMTGTTGEQLAKARFPGADIKSFDDVMDAVAALKAGQIEAVIMAYSNAMYVTKHNPDMWYLPEPVEKEDMAVGARKGNDALLAAVDKIIAELISDGTLEDMKKRWFKQDLSPYEQVDPAVPTDGAILKIGVSATREPFCFTDENGRITGYDGELARRIGIELGKPVEFFDMKFSALIPALQAGKIDLAISMTPTEERKKSINFSQPVFASAQVMLVKKAPGTKANSGKMASLDDIDGKRVAVYTGTIHDAFVASHYPRAEIKRFDSTADMVLALKNKKTDVAFYDLTSAKVLLKNNPELGILSDDALTKPLGVGFNKNNPMLRDRFNNYLKTARADGTYDEMYRRWFEDDPEKVEMPEFKYPETGEEIVLGVAVADLPHVAYVNEKYVGFDIEMLQRFAQHEGLRLKIKTMEFSALIVALASGKVDMITDGIAITEERQKQIDFSEPCMDLKTAVVALKTNIASCDDVGGAAGKNVSFLSKAGDSFYNNIILENRYLLIMNGLKVTIIISLLATFFGTLLGALICFMRMSQNKVLQQPAKVYISILRGTPVLVLLMIIFYIVFASIDIDPVLVAVVAFGMNFAAYVSEMFRTGIESVDKGQIEAGIATGFTKAKTFLYIVLPQAVRQILPVYKGEFISLVKMTSVVGYIAVQDLTKASDIIRSRTFDAFFPLIMVAVLYFFISWLLSLSLGYVEWITDPKARRKQVYRG